MFFKIFINFAHMKALFRNNIRNSSLWFYLAAALCIIVQLLSVEYHYNVIADLHWLDHIDAITVIKLIINGIADVLILMLPFVALKPKCRKWSWIVIWLVTLWCLAQLLYMPTYRDLMPFSSFLLVDNMGSTLAKSTIGAFTFGDLEVILPPILLYIAYRVWLKDGIESETISGGRRLLLFILCIAAFVGIRASISAWHYNDDETTHSYRQQLTNDYCVMWTSQGDYLNINGAVPYATYCAINTIFNKTTLTPEEKQEVGPNATTNMPPHEERM